MREFVPGLEGVVAFETQIAEPDREGGTLRYLCNRSWISMTTPRGRISLTCR